MRGGEITGNSAPGAFNNNTAGGVFLSAATSRFYMQGGSVRGNTRGTDNVPADVNLAAAANYFTLSGNATIGRLLQSGGGSGVNAHVAPVTIGSGWTGRVYYLDLWRGHNSISDVINNMVNHTVMQAEASHTLTAGYLERMGYTLACFIGTETSVPQPVSQAHRIVLENGNTIGVLMPNP